MKCRKTKPIESVCYYWWELILEFQKSAMEVVELPYGI